MTMALTAVEISRPQAITVAGISMSLAIVELRRFTNPLDLTYRTTYK